MSRKEYLEIDIAVNFYNVTWKTHATWQGSSEPDHKQCLHDALSHEFGHFAGLEHVDYRPDRNDGRNNCSEWGHYTMMNQPTARLEKIAFVNR